MIHETHEKKPIVKVLTREQYLRQLAAGSERLNIRLTNDYAFRKTFKNPTVAKGFIMAVTGIKEEEILKIEVADPYEEGESDDDKDGILDVKLHLNDNRKLNIEMQNRFQEDWSERSIFYNCRMFTEGFTHGSTYGSLEPCIHIGILNFIQLKSPGFHHQMLLMDKKTHEVYSSKFQFHVIELKKLKDVTEAEKEQEPELYKWAKVIAAKSWEAICMETKGNPYMEAAKDELEKINQDENERYLYLRREMAISDEISRLQTAVNQGRREGLEEGRKAGLEDGEFLKLISLIKKKYLKGKTLTEIAEDLEESTDDLEEIYNVVKANSQDSDDVLLKRIRQPDEEKQLLG